MRVGSPQCRIRSTPEGAEVRVIDWTDQVVASGTTPLDVKLRSAQGYLRPARYRLEYRKEGFRDGASALHAEPSLWTLGNAVLPGAVLWLFGVDAVTGKMWRLPESSEVVLYPVPPSVPAP